MSFSRLRGDKILDLIFFSEKAVEISRILLNRYPNLGAFERKSLIIVCFLCVIETQNSRMRHFICDRGAVFHSGCKLMCLPVVLAAGPSLL